jgi:PAS domain S-box-containing protein
MPVNTPRFSSVLTGLGAILILITVGVALVDRDPYANSLLQGGVALVVGMILVAAGLRLHQSGRDHRSWRSVAWPGALVVVTSLELLWAEVLVPVVGNVTLPFSVVTTLAIGVGAGTVVAWYDRRRRLRASEHAEQQRSYREVFNKVEDAILVHDSDTGAIIDANSSAETVYGYSPERLMEMDVADFSDTDGGYTQALAEAKVQKAIDQDGTTFEWRCVRPDESRAWLEVSLRPAEIAGKQRVLAVVRDISERKQRERELRVKDRALEAADVGVTITDANSDQELLYANEAFLDVTGHDRDAVLGRNCRFLQGEETSDEAVEELRQAVAKAEPTSVDLLNYRADGTPFWNRVSIAPVRDSDAVTHFVGFQQDVTEEKRRERLFSVMNRVLRHNLRNDMMVVGGHAELLADRLDGEAADMAKTVEEAAADLTSLGEKARELESAVTGETNERPRDVAAIVRRVGDDLRESHPKKRVTVDTPEAARAIAVERIERALTELGENALEHGGGAVEFDVRAADEMLTVEVRDDGPGLPKMEQRVLERGRETPLDHGQGIGLPLASWLVADGQGDIAVEVDDGTTVTIELKRAPSAPSPESLAESE